MVIVHVLQTAQFSFVFVLVCPARPCLQTPASPVLIYRHQHPGLFDRRCGGHFWAGFFFQTATIAWIGMFHQSGFIPCVRFSIHDVGNSWHTHTKKRDATILKEVTISSDPQASKSCSEGCFRRHYVNLLVIMNIWLCNQFRVCRDQQLRNVSSHYEYENC